MYINTLLNNTLEWKSLSIKQNAQLFHSSLLLFLHIIIITYF